MALAAAAVLALATAGLGLLEPMPGWYYTLAWWSYDLARWPAGDLAAGLRTGDPRDRFLERRVHGWGTGR